MKKKILALLSILFLSGCEFTFPSFDLNINGSDQQNTDVNGSNSNYLPGINKPTTEKVPTVIPEVDVDFKLSKSEEKGKYTLTISTDKENVKLTNKTFEYYKYLLEFDDGVDLKDRDYSDYFMLINKVYIAENITTIEDFTLLNYLSDFDLYLSEDVTFIDEYAFFYDLDYSYGQTMTSFDIYLEGDMPKTNTEYGLKFRFPVITMYYNEGAQGFDKEYDFYNCITYKKIGEKLEYPDITIEQYA